MKSFRSLGLLIALPCLVAGLLVASSSSQAAGHALTVSTYNVAINESGLGRVYVGCHTSTTCKGGIYIDGDYGAIQHYSVPGHTLAYVFVKVDKTFAAYPYDAGQHEGDYNDHGPFQLVVKETSPKLDIHQYTVLPQTKVPSRHITGKVSARIGSPVEDDVNVQLWQAGRGGTTKFIKSQGVANNGTYSLAVPLGTNNASSAEYELRITGKDDEGDFQAWFWRGTNHFPRGGGKYIAEASKVRATKTGDFVADFTYGSISGTTRRADNSALPNTTITVAAPPVRFGDSTYNRNLDITNCANILGQTESDPSGNYQVSFLPFDPLGDKRYVVQADARPNYPSTELLALWNDEFGSCQNATGYDHSTDQLIDLSSGNQVQSFKMRNSTNTLAVNADYSGYTPSSDGDRWVRVREKVPGVHILDAPVVDEAKADSHGVVSFTNLPRGVYWVETGRRTGCSEWFPSVYSNNNAYFNGADRGAEAWKTVAGKYPEYQKSYDMGYVAKTPPSGYHGWMYREQCTAYGAGAWTTIAFHSNDNNERQTSTPTDKKGAVVTGHVSRSGGRTNKEILVRLSSSGGTRVLRTDVADRGGNFSVKGLATGSYTISVNSDSWRGIGRTFGGKHTIYVTAGHSYSVGTLSFQG